MRVTSDRQTLILAGETPPRRSVAGRNDADVAVDALTVDSEAGEGTQRVTIISARIDAIVQATFGSAATVGNFLAAADVPQVATLAPTVHQAYALPSRGYSSNGAGAYARTRDLSDLSDKTALIDTYA